MARAIFQRVPCSATGQAFDREWAGDIQPGQGNLPLPNTTPSFAKNITSFPLIAAAAVRLPPVWWLVCKDR